MAATSASREKSELLVKLGKLIDVAGCQTAWETLAEELGRIPLRALRALVYRVERARGEAYEDGNAHGENAGAPLP